MLNEGNHFSAFENKVLRKIYRPKIDKVSGEFRISCNEQLCDFYKSHCPPMVVNSRTGCCDGVDTNAHRVSVRKG